MPSDFYDDPVWQSGGDDRIKFTVIGDSARGRITNLRKIKIGGDTIPIATLANVEGRQEGQSVRWASADLNLSGTHLKRIWGDAKPEIGDVVEVTFVENRPVGQPSPMKVFALNFIQRGAAAAPQPQPVPVAAQPDAQQPSLSDDTFG